MHLLRTSSLTTTTSQGMFQGHYTRTTSAKYSTISSSQCTPHRILTLPTRSSN